MTDLQNATLCILGCGNLGQAILSSLLANKTLPVTNYIACVRTTASATKLSTRFPAPQYPNLTISTSEHNIPSITKADIIILAADPADITSLLKQPGLATALTSKLLISVAAGWTRQALESALYDTPSTTENTETEKRAWVIRTLPNIAALVSQSLTAIEISDPAVPKHLLTLTETLFSCIGRTLAIPPKMMDAATAVAGSTPAFFAAIVDAMVDAAVAVGVPREMAQSMVYQAMAGTAGMLQSGVHPGVLKDQGTSPEGCTIGGLMVLEEGGVRGVVGKAVREAVTVARLMDGERHLNDTRQ